MVQGITNLLLQVGDKQSKPSTVGLNAFDLGERQGFIGLCSLEELSDVLQPGGDREREGRVKVTCSVMLNLQCCEYIYPLLHPNQQCGIDILASGTETGYGIGEFNSMNTDK